MSTYSMMFATTGLGLPLLVIKLIASVVYYYANRAKGRLVQLHSLQMYSQVSISLLNSILIIWTAINLFDNKPLSNLFWGLLITTGIFIIIYFAYSIIAAIKVKKGWFYLLPIQYRLIHLNEYCEKDNYSRA